MDTLSKMTGNFKIIAKALVLCVEKIRNQLHTCQDCKNPCVQIIVVFHSKINKIKQKQKRVILSALCLPDFEIPHSLSTLNRCLLTTMEQGIPFHKIPLTLITDGLLQPQGGQYTLSAHI